jgi:hypothetical protein
VVKPKIAGSSHRVQLPKNPAIIALSEQNSQSINGWQQKQLTQRFKDGASEVIEPVDVFISYSHKDETLKDQLLEHLSALRNEGLIRIWHDRDIDAGDYWINEINNHIETSAVILLLVTSSFLASRYCYSIELERALDRALAGEAKVIPIVLRPVDWESTKFGSLQALPTGGRPVTTWKNQYEAFLNIAVNLRSSIKALSSKSYRLLVANKARSSLAPELGTIRYYLYVSDTKVNMLFPPIPNGIKEEVAQNLGLHGFAWSQDESEEAVETRRIYKLETVVRFIMERFQVGTIDTPNEYITGTHTIECGHTHHSIAAPYEENPFVFFKGRTDRTTLLMSESSKYLIGNHKPPERGYSSSSVPHVIESLLRDIELEGKSLESLEVANRIAPHEKRRLPYSGKDLALAIVEETHMDLSSARQELEFLAKMLLHGPSPRWEDRMSFLASPLYVALAI